MIKIIAGNKGSGKTKRLIDMTNDTAKTAAGNVVFLDKDNSYMYEIDRAVRFVNVNDYYDYKKEASADKLLGFLCGMLASNYDISTIFVDAFLKLVSVELADSEWFFAALEKLGQKSEATFVLSVSADPEALPEFCKKYVI